MEPGRIKTFVIGPIGDRDSEEGSTSKKTFENAIETFEYIIKPACIALDLEPIRADQITRSGDIHDQIYRNLRDAHVVIADLTGANPNVMYELGLRHTTGKLTFQIGEKDDLPFDISTIRTILFKRTDAGFVQAKRSLLAALIEGLEKGSDPVASTRVWFEVPAADEKDKFTAQCISEDEDYDDDGEYWNVEDEEAGFLEMLADTEAGIPEISATLGRGAAILQELAATLNAGTEAINNLPQTGNYSASKLKVVNGIAQKLADPEIRLRMVAKEFKNNIDQATPGIQYMLAELSKSQELPEGGLEFIESISELVNVAETSISSSEDLANSLEASGNPTRMMRRMNSLIKSSALSMAQTSRKVGSWKNFLTRDQYSD